MESLWRKQMGKKLRQEEETDGAKKDAGWEVIVIGAGMAGLLTAYFLKEQGKRVLVLEADTVASGQTERTTAKITSQHDIKYSRLILSVGRKKAGMYAAANEAAIEEYARLVKEHKIDCQFMRTSAYLYTCRSENVGKLEKEAAAAAWLGIDAFFTKETELPFPVKGAVCFRGQAHFSPLAFVQFICRDLDIREHTRVISVRGNKVITDKGCLRADKIVMTTHYPVRNIPGFYFLRQHQERSYVLALEGCPVLKGMYYGIDPNGLSLRQAGELLLFGGEGHRTGSNKNGGCYERLAAMARQYYPDSTETARWSAQDCMPHDGIPFIGRYSVFTPNLYVATGFQKWGMTSSMVAAMIFREELCGRKSIYAKLFSPQRLHLRGSLRNLLVDVGVSIKGIFKGFFHRPRESAAALLPGHGGIVSVKGQRFACYCDEKGILHKISARCPHMGCELEWNPDEKTWDCPCHGSRFDVDGSLIDNPAKGPAAATE